MSPDDLAYARAIDIARWMAGTARARLVAAS